ncbi:MAG: DsrE family protein [Alphaproteobacteria bacterium]|nr:DsrE family protein [Alphaproteobacteria bacterium]
MVILSGRPALGGADAFSKGPLIKEFGPVATVEMTRTLPADSRFAVSFDVAEQSEEGKVNRRIESAARFLNMHVAAGVKAENITLAIVIHGKAVFDVSRDARHGAENATAELVKILLQHGVRIQVCGQSAAYYDVGPDDLLPGVEMALSAMTAHAQLQQQGFTLNP